MIYYSKRNKGVKVDTLRNIMCGSIVHNIKNDITSLLFYNDGFFIQMLEGAQEGIDKVYEKIQTDRRHSEVTTIDFSAIKHRKLAGWPIAFAGMTNLLSDILAELKLELSINPHDTPNEKITEMMECLAKQFHFEINGMPSVQMEVLLESLSVL